MTDRARMYCRAARLDAKRHNEFQPVYRPTDWGPDFAAGLV